MVTIKKHNILQQLRGGTRQPAVTFRNRPFYQNRQNPYSRELFGQLMSKLEIGMVGNNKTLSEIGMQQKVFLKRGMA